MGADQSTARRNLETICRDVQQGPSSGALTGAAVGAATAWYVAGEGEKVGIPVLLTGLTTFTLVGIPCAVIGASLGLVVGGSTLIVNKLQDLIQGKEVPQEALPFLVAITVATENGAISDGPERITRVLATTTGAEAFKKEGRRVLSFMKLKELYPQHELDYVLWSSADRLVKDIDPDTLDACWIAMLSPSFSASELRTRLPEIMEPFYNSLTQEVIEALLEEKFKRERGHLAQLLQKKFEGSSEAECLEAVDSLHSTLSKSEFQKGCLLLAREDVVAPAHTTIDQLLKDPLLSQLKSFLTTNFAISPDELSEYAAKGQST